MSRPALVLIADDDEAMRSLLSTSLRSRGFEVAECRDGRELMHLLQSEATGVRTPSLVISDLRMGQEPTYVFSHAVAARGNPHWKEIPAELLPVSFGDRALAGVWDRIWRPD